MSRGYSAAACLIAILSANVAAQSLGDKMEWPHDFLQAQSPLASRDGNWYDHYSVTANGCEVTIQHDVEDVSCTKPKNNCSPPTTIVDKSYSRQVFNLRDLDLGRISIEENPSFYAWTVEMPTRNERPLIATSDKRLGADSFTKRSWVDEDNRRAYLVLRSNETAERVGSAFRHVVGLCGGKASPF